MNPEPPTGHFGRTPAQVFRSAALLTLLGCGAILGVERSLTRPDGPLGAVFARSGLPPILLQLGGCGTVLAFAVMGAVRSLQGSPRFTLTHEGLRVEGSLGRYVLEWSNIRKAAVTKTGLGFRVRSREAVVRTHQGTAQQREWLQSQEPYGEWDFLFPEADLGFPPSRVLTWITPHLPMDETG